MAGSLLPRVCGAAGPGGVSGRWREL